MTRTTQDKFADALAAIAAEHDLELVNDRDWANTGTFRLESPDSFAPVISMRYSFQNGYASFNELTPAGLGDRSTGLSTHFPYVTSEELESRVLVAVRRHLATRKEASLV